ncbi:hypothetical protein A2774_01740 [Candidatus Roizmanbacteria bacterium RIFCSPHIGHO2_01_FULL_39_12c]|uniref:Purple acid phosphatase N-terminal domain-containing protein n=1 Tax=Candidatus Roizmanbacteria bacterium RIFCSPHIGHO2_01_FULL_39_12c TaxID=1802031 RepID=A0A1F7GAX6_9BACT|nr:MAG: hypothetical protein A2774_01740 [Candidatus Roizmanbacteria bacterium RIFCSPHIGHO2_01_FULL_39_12c]
MTYSKYFLPQTAKVPFLLTVGVIMIIIMILARTFSPNSLPLKASKKIVSSLDVMNLTHNQAKIFWQTEEKQSGWVIFGENERTLNRVTIDERDLQDKRSRYKNHLVTLKNLKSNSRYFYKIISDNQVVEADDGKAFSFITPAKIATSPDLVPAYGKLIRENGGAVQNAIIIFTLDNIYPLVTLTKTTGEWLIPLNYLVNKNSLKLHSVPSDATVTIVIVDESSKITKIQARFSHLSPIPQTVILGKDYNFLDQGGVLSASVKNKSGQKTKFEILFPRDSAVIPGGKPLIKGASFAGNQVIVSIDNDPGLSYKVSADKQGVWSVILSTNLPVGGHTLKARSTDTEGKETILSRNFSVAKSGEQVLGEATAEASPTLMPTEVPELPSPTIEFSPYLTQPPTFTPTPPTSGVDIKPFGVMSASLIILGLGILFAF